MNKITLFLLAFMAVSSVAVSQNKAVAGKNNAGENIYTSLKPADGQGAVFNSKEELNAKVQDKKDKIITMIKENAGDSVAVKRLRWELWRFENAVVVTPK